jgi:hypothetical protein
MAASFAQEHHHGGLCADRMDDEDSSAIASSMHNQA